MVRSYARFPLSHKESAVIVTPLSGARRGFAAPRHNFHFLVRFTSSLLPGPDVMPVIRPVRKPQPVNCGIP